MSLSPASSFPVPERTVEIAHAALPKGNRYRQMRDTLGTMDTHADFADLSPTVRQPQIVKKLKTSFVAVLLTQTSLCIQTTPGRLGFGTATGSIPASPLGPLRFRGCIGAPRDL